MFIFKPTINFNNYSKKIGTEKREELQILLFSYFGMYFGSAGEADFIHFAKDSTTSKENSFFLPSAFDIKTIDFDRILARIIKAVKIYLLTFYDFQYMIEDFKENFEFYSYSDYANLNETDIKNRLIDLIINNYKLLIDINSFKKNQKSNDIPSSPRNVFEKSDYYTFKRKYNIDEDYIYLRLSKFAHTDSDIFNQNAFRETLRNGNKYSSLNDALHDIHTYSKESFLSLMDEMPLFGMSASNRITSIKSFSEWHSILQNLSSLLIRLDIFNEIQEQFKFSNHFISKYYIDKPEELQEPALSEILKRGKISLPHLAHIMRSKSRLKDSIVISKEENRNKHHRVSKITISSDINKGYPLHDSIKNALKLYYK